MLAGGDRLLQGTLELGPSSLWLKHRAHANESPPVCWSCVKFSNAFSCSSMNQRRVAITSESACLRGLGWPVCALAMV